MGASVNPNGLPRVDWQNVNRNDHPNVVRSGNELIVRDCVLVDDTWNFLGSGFQRASFIDCRLDKPITMVFPDGTHGACFERLTLGPTLPHATTVANCTHVTIKVPNGLLNLEIQGVGALTWHVEASRITNFRLSGTFADIEVSGGQYQTLDVVDLSATKLEFGNCHFGERLAIREVKIDRISFGVSNFPANVVLENITSNVGEPVCEFLLSPGCVIRNNFELSKCAFSALVIRGAHIMASGKIRIEDVHCSPTFDWSTLIFEPGGRLNFLRTPLANSLCIGTRIETANITFGPGCWIASRRGTQLLGDRIANSSVTKVLELRRAIRDCVAIQIERQEVIQHTLENYSALVKHHEDRREFALAELFHVGEMEMMRLRRATSENYFVSWCQENLSFIGLYQLCSLYGSSYGRALSVLAGMILILALFFMANGVGCYSVELACRGFKYSFALGSGLATVGASDYLYDLWRSIVYVVEVAALQKDPTFVPITTFGRFVRAVVPVLIAGQVALLIFALRRNFRRTSAV